MTYYPSQVTQHYLGYAWVLLNLLDMISWLMELESTGLLTQVWDKSFLVMMYFTPPYQIYCPVSQMTNLIL